MSEEQQNTRRDLNEAITNMIEQLVAYRRKIWAWREQPHTLKDTIARQKELQIMSDELSGLSIELLKQKRKAGVHERAVNANLRTIEIARGYDGEIRDCLQQDYDAKKKEIGAIDVVKNATFIFGLPAAFVTGVKNGIGNGHVGVNEALVLGFAVSIPTVFHKQGGGLVLEGRKSSLRSS